MQHKINWKISAGFLLCVSLFVSGCASPYRADRGAMAGGLTGAGLGYLVGDATGHEGAGTAIGAVAGTLIGGAIGQGMDDVEAQNRAMIQQQAASRGTVTVNDVVQMTRANVDPNVIVTQIRNNGLATPLQSQDIIALNSQGVHPSVIQAMQTPVMASRGAYPPTIVPAGGPVIIEERYYGPPGPVFMHPYHHCHGRPGVSWGVAVGG
jgi:hypothetical protein